MRRTIAVLLLAGFAFTACAGNDSKTPASEPLGPVAPTAEAKVPDLQIPDGPPPTTLVIEDITVGDGAQAKAGSSVTVNYLGKAWSTKKQFDSSYDRGKPITFSLNGVIQGWGEGIPGMKVGGRRKLTIPPDKGYGAQGAGADIGPNETLVFIVDLLAVQ